MANVMADDAYRIVKEKQIRDLWDQNKIDAEKAIDLLKQLKKVLDTAREAKAAQDLFERDLMHVDDDDEFI